VPILVVDDEPDVRRNYAKFLASRGIVVHEALLCEIAHGGPNGRHVFFAGKGELADIVRAHAVAECEYIDLSAGPEGLLREVGRDGSSSNSSTTTRPSQPPVPPGLIAESPKMRALRQRIGRLAEVDSTVLITGESGTGKETVAREIFRAWVHRRCEFIPVNCGAIPEGLIESELFGHKRGSFTGAVADKEGMVEKANHGVLFLDEIGEMPPTMQVRLLRFLDSGEFRRVGDPTLRRTDVRVIAATNRPLDREIAAGRFRLDLFYRLSVVSLHVPPLRERPEDVSLLAACILRRIAPRLRTQVRGLSDQAFLALQAYHWPGNVRELQNVIECATIIATGDTITADDVRKVLTDCHAVQTLMDAAPVDGRDRMADVLALFGGNQSRAAEALGISRTTLWRRQRRAASR
jgi:DNA-binding NtrC family response regulator